MLKKIPCVTILFSALFALVFFANLNPVYADTHDYDVQTSSSASRVVMYRLYNSYTGEHFYTSDVKEKNSTVSAGWKDEGTGWIAPSTSNTPVYRLYNPYAVGGDHHYTMDLEEKNKAVAAGWKDEGIGWYSVDEGDTDRIEVYRQYNPYATTGTHNYTTNTTERDKLVTAGWYGEGIAWYAYSKLSPSAREIDFSKALVDVSTQDYSGSQIKPSVSIPGLTKDVDYTVTYGTNLNAGTGTITIKGKGSYSGTKTYTFKIGQLDISKATITLGNSLTYNATKQTQTVKSVKVGKLTLKASDYILANNTATNAGNYTLVIVGKGNYSGVANKTFNVAKANPRVTAPLDLVIRPGAKLSSVEIPAQGGTATLTPGKWEWVNPEESVEEENYDDVESFDAKFVPTDTSNYNTVVQLLSVKVEPEGIKVTFVANSPANVEAKVDGESKETKVLPFDGGKKVHTLKDSSFPSETKITSTDTKKWVFAGWSTNKDDKVVSGSTTILTQNDLVNSATTLSETTTYYAIWMQSDGFWMGSKDASESYDSEAYFAMHDANYISGTQIKADMLTLHSNTSADRTVVK